MTNPKRYLITSALPYANGYKHIGHLAGAYVPADIYVRYLRSQKRDVVFVCGSDEHGTAIPLQAMKEGTSSQEIIDKYHEIIKKNFEDLSISFDIYDRTSNPLHHETASEFFTYLNDRGALEIKETEQYYDEEAQTFLADRYIKGTCPNCGFEGAFGDQCERCGRTLSPDELINPVSTLSGKALVKKPTRHWYLPLNQHEKWLREWIIDEHGSDWKANVVGQCKSWIDGGLEPRAVTRDLDWGVKVPLPDAEGKVLYVWFDAPIGYISATKQWAINTGSDWKPYWLEKDTKLVHFIGKDNIVFHCIIFPLMLKLHGYNLPDNVPANEFMNLEGEKMSTSRGWKLDMNDYVDDFINKENGGPQLADALRYYLITILPESKDSDFTWEGFRDAVNSELVSIFGNFVNRCFVLMHKLTSGKVPRFHNELMDDADKALLESMQHTKTEVEDLLEQYKFREALFVVIDLARSGNKYLQEKEPWKKASAIEKLKKENPDASIDSLQDQIDNSLHISLQLCANLAILINPFLPNTAKKMIHMMKVVEKMLDWENAGKTKLLSVGYSLREPQLLFRKIEEAEIDYQITKLKQGLERSKQAQQGSMPPTIIETAPVKSLIEYPQFDQLDLRVGTILSAMKVEKTDKLLKLEVDLGFEKRTIVSGIALHFSPGELVDKQVTVVANLAPRKMRGIESQGMILTAEQPDGKLVLLSPAMPTANGSIVK